jgi:hypothetical protein
MKEAATVLRRAGLRFAIAKRIITPKQGDAPYPDQPFGLALSFE